MRLRQLSRKERQIMHFLHAHIFDSILVSPQASEPLKKGVRYTITRLEERDAAGMVQYYWSAIVGTERASALRLVCDKKGSSGLRKQLTNSGWRFNDRFLRLP